MAEVVLETERLLLRRFTEADAELLFELDSDPEVMRYLSGGPPTPREVIEREILPGFLRYYERCPAFGFWAAIERATGAFLGWFSFRPADGGPADEVHLGYRLRRAAWGRGYATEGARALIRKGFTELGVRRVVASTFEANSASRRVMEKSGMTLVQTYRMTSAELLAEDTYCLPSSEPFDGNDVDYALDRSDWERQEGR